MLVKETCCYTDIGKYRISAEVTSRCVFKCFYCYRNIVGLDLDFNLLKNKIEFLREFSDDFLITGGEPFLHPRIKEIIELLSSYEFNIAISTSGYKTNQYTTILLESKIRSWNLSLDSVNQKINDLIRGNKSYYWFKVGLEVGKVLKETQNTRIKVQIVLSNYNIKTLLDTVEYLANIPEIDVIVISSVFPFVYKIPNRLERLLEEYGKRIVLTNINLPKKDYTCILGKLIHILPDGSITPCSIYTKKLGYLAEIKSSKDLINIIGRYRQSNKVKVCPAIIEKYNLK